MPIVANLLKTTFTSPSDLYKAFEGNKNKIYEEFTKTHKKEIIAQVNDAILIEEKTVKNELIRTITILSYDALLLLANTFYAKKKFKAFQICLGLIISDGVSAFRDDRITGSVLAQLLDFYKKHPQADETVAGINKKYSELAQLTLDSRQSYLSATIVESNKITAVGPSFMGTQHVAQHVRYKRSAEDKSEAQFIEKREVESRVGGIEVFSGTLMELFIGPHQPTTLQKARSALDFTNNTVSILSEEIQITRFAERTPPLTYQGLKVWAMQNFKGAAVIDVATLFLADDYFALSDGGLRNDNNLAVRYDFDKTIAPKTQPLLSKDGTIPVKMQIIKSERKLLSGLLATDCFVINADDLNNLPLLMTNGPRPEIALCHYVPTTWWTNNLIDSSDLHEQIKALRTDPAYLNDKFRSILEKIILPTEVIQHFIEASIFHERDKKEILTWMLARQQEMRATAIKVTGFLNFMHNNGARAFEEIKTRYRHFIEKRNIFNVNTPQILQAYDTNFENYRKSLPLDNKIDASLLKDQTICRQFPRIEKLFEEIRQINNKPEYRERFAASLASLKLEELNNLSYYMQDVQLGKVVNHPFTLIRTERSRFFHTSGNTTSWGVIRHAVKAEILARLHEIYPKNGGAILEAKSFDYYSKMMGQHSGRSYARWGRTNSLKVFDRRYKKAVNNETPTAGKIMLVK